jgi:type IV pilus assembly protein PilM
MFLFKKKPKNSLGIDIGASAIKFVELEKKDGRHVLKNYAIYSLKEYLKKSNYQVGLSSLKITNQEIAEIIKRTIKKANIVSNSLCLSVPVYSSFSTVIDFPDMPEKEIASAVSFEAKKYIPVPVSEVILDWSIVGNVGKTSDGKSVQQILLVAVPKDLVNGYNQIVRLSGLKLKAIEEEAFSLSRALIGNDKSVAVMIDSGARSLNVSIVDNGYIKNIHNLEMGGVKLNKIIASQMNIDLEKAEALKKKLPDSELANGHYPRLRGVIHSSLEVVVAEIKKIIDSYQEKYDRKVEKCILVGGGVRLFEFVDFLSKRLNVDVSLGDPFARIVYPSLLKPALKELGPSLAVATGLAMREN